MTPQSTPALPAAPGAPAAAPRPRVIRLLSLGTPDRRPRFVHTPEIPAESEQRPEPDAIAQLSFLEDLRQLKIEIMNNANDVVNELLLARILAERRAQLLAQRAALAAQTTP